MCVVLYMCVPDTHIQDSAFLASEPAHYNNDNFKKLSSNSLQSSKNTKSPAVSSTSSSHRNHPKPGHRVCGYSEPRAATPRPLLICEYGAILGHRGPRREGGHKDYHLCCKAATLSQLKQHNPKNEHQGKL